MAKNLTIQDEPVYNEQMNWLERILVRWHSLTRMEMRWRSLGKRKRRDRSNL